MDFKTYMQINPDIFRLPKNIQQIRFENINKYREDTIELVKEKREKIIEEEEKKKNNKNDLPQNGEEKEKKPKKKLQILNLEKMLSDLKKKEEKDIEKIKQKQKNEIFHQVEKRLKIK
jgi:hypothetical protein